MTYRNDEPSEWNDVVNELARQRREREEGADAPLRCPDCDEVTGDGERCSECLSERASYYVGDDGPHRSLPLDFVMGDNEEGGQG